VAREKASDLGQIEASFDEQKANLVKTNVLDTIEWLDFLEDTLIWEKQNNNLKSSRVINRSYAGPILDLNEGIKSSLNIEDCYHARLCKGTIDL
jgi:hypothetical protein